MRLQLGQLPRVVGTGRLHRIGAFHAQRGAIFPRRHGKNIGEVVLALRVVAIQPRDPAAQRGRVGGENTGVDQRDGALFRGGVLLFDDFGDLPGRIAKHAAVAVRVIEARSEQAQRAAGLHQRPQRVGTDQRHVAIKNQHLRAVGDGRQRLLDGVARAQPFGLQHPAQIGLAGKGRAHFMTGVAVNNVDRRRL